MGSLVGPSTEHDSLDWLDIEQVASDDGHTTLDICVSVAMAHQAAVQDNLSTLLNWLLLHGGSPDESGEGLARWSMDDQRSERLGRFEVSVVVDLDAALLLELQAKFDLGLI
ncbi:MAG: hypothetical protein QMC46_06435 [Burkholderiaceae bacterium]|jgi:hypothetical protein|tara:strand:- start:1028 stop:1363 length:336 start_codon:yes stop_codon:yes gene_type:complete